MSRLTDEHYRILRAAAEDRLAIKTDSGRWCITPKITGEWSMETEPLPDFKARRQLMARGLIDYKRAPRDGPTTGDSSPPTRGATRSLAEPPMSSRAPGTQPEERAA